MKNYTALLDLQTIDIELLRIKKLVQNMPHKKKLAAIEAAKKKIAGELLKIVGKRKDVEIEIGDSEELLGKLEGHVKDIRQKTEAGEAGYRELRDVEYQLSQLAKKIDRTNFKLNDLFAKLEKLETAEAGARALDEKLSNEFAELVMDYKNKSEALKSEAKRLAEKRDELRRGIDAAALADYDEAKERFGGLCVETLRGNVPSVCRVALQPAQFSDLKHAEGITHCPYCKRLLITEEPTETEADR